MAGFRSLLLFGLILAGSAWAQESSPAAVPPAQVTNGCGSGAFGFLVPNKTWLSQCKFEESCNRHDICYGKCLEGGALEGRPECNVQADRRRRREVCDASLQADIITANPGKAACSMYAALYRFAVQAIGESFFHGASAGSATEQSLVQFMAYVNRHPDAFDASEVERLFDSLQRPGGAEKVTVMFLASRPALIVQKSSGEELVVTGRKAK